MRALSASRDEDRLVTGETEMTTVYLLWHTHDLGEGETDDKLIGVYATEADAGQAWERASALPGFCEALEGFSIHPRIVGQDDWLSGYVTKAHGASGA